MNQLFTITLANTDWDRMVNSMHSAFDGTDHSIKLLFGIGILTILWINIRLARWITKKFNHPHHPHHHPHPPHHEHHDSHHNYHSHHH